MDLGAVKDNIKSAIKLMTPEMQLDASRIFQVIVKHMPTIEKIGPELAAMFMPIIQAGAFEFAMGMVDKEGLEMAFREAFGECGIVIPGKG